ncbi:glycerate kinase [Actinomadura barringtoniae]|uniref:Glycerate kinase n=1 Tax=Actinomadura barringtoniae TaxID=1427535 RepID=A0A939PIH4_9ACTN|nr:glycerate kinase [Actinomadura barringtoniae]MBO2450434.1 glycerate kinase [Actinomadura barringtoniae]
MSNAHRGQVVIAPDKFKGSLTAVQVAEHVAAGLRRVRPDLPLVALPVADGGDGTVDAAVACGFARLRTSVTGPIGEPVTASYAVRDATAVIELAEASGLRRLPGGESGKPEFAPLIASSRGTGELIDAAVRGGATRIVLGLGGSACTDGGAGMAEALGVRFLDSSGAPLPPGGAALRSLASIDTRGLDERLDGVTFIVASDVDNPLLGPEGAAAIFGPQKGASPSQVRTLENGLARLENIARRDLGAFAAKRPGAGAAGGVGFGAMTFLDASVRPGIAFLLDLLGFAEQVAGARLVITGEGSLDRQSLRGKAPIGVARAAARATVPTVAVAGRRTLTGEQLRKARLQSAYAIADIESDPERCMTEAGPLLERLAEEIGRTWLKEPAPAGSASAGSPSAGSPSASTLMGGAA